MKNIIIISSLFLTTMAGYSSATENHTAGNKAQGGTGFKINFFRTFTFDEDTVIKEDGQTLPELNAQGGTGYKIRYTLNSEVNQDLTAGVFAEVDLINVLKGPITSLDPLRVFNTELLTTAETYYPNELELTDFVVADTIKASGFVFSDSDALVTRMQPIDSSENWKLSGFVEQLSSSQFAINGQLVSYGMKDVSGCTVGLAEGDFVEVLASPIMNFTPGQVLSTVVAVNCVDRSVVADGATDLPVAVEGLIDVVAMDGDFVLAGQYINVDNQTRYIRGKAEDIQEKIKVEVEGEVNAVTGEIMADKVRFLDARFTLVVPVAPVDVVNNDQINVAGVVVRLTPQTQDPDLVLQNGVINPIQLKIKGYVDSDLNLYATKIEDKGAANFNEVDLRGEVSGINQPLLEVFGVEADTTGSTLLDTDDQPISAAAFFALIIEGSEIEIEQATYNPTEQRLELGTIRIESINDDGVLNSAQKAGLLIQAKGVGTVTSLPDPIFDNSFE